MKKLIAILAGVVIAASAVYAQTNQVMSRNAVGYVKVTLQPSQLYLVANPFVNLESADDPLLTNTYAAVPPGTVVSVWNEGTSIFDNYSRNTRGAWVGAALTAKVKRADGVFLRMSTNAAVDLFLLGEVPDRFTAPSSFVSRLPSITMHGLPYPVTIKLTNTVMASQVPPGTVISVWDPNATSYVNYSKNTRGAWVGDALTADILPGQGMVIRATNAANSWYETKPYTWP